MIRRLASLLSDLFDCDWLSSCCSSSRRKSTEGGGVFGCSDCFWVECHSDSISFEMHKPQTCEQCDKLISATESAGWKPEEWHPTPELHQLQLEAGRGTESQQVIGSWRPVSHLSELFSAGSNPQLIKWVNSGGEVCFLSPSKWVNAWKIRVWGDPPRPEAFKVKLLRNQRACMYL